MAARTSRTLVLAGALLMTGLGLAAQAGAYCANEGRLLRVMTYNVACVNGIVSNQDTFQDDDVTRMKNIAKHIKLEDPDVVIINEAWSEGECKDTLIEELKGTYASYIYEVDSFGFLALNDSGLMLFAKDRFIKFLQDAHQKSGVDDWSYLAYGVTETSGGALIEWGGGSRRDVAYQIFPNAWLFDWLSPNASCYHHDCLADKAAAMVRLQGLCPYNVAFTHTQAHYDLNDPSALNGSMNARNLQLVHAGVMITSSLQADQLREEPVFFGGDFNIDGNRAHPTVWPGAGKPEWEVYFKGAQGGPFETSLYACGFDGMKHGTSCNFGVAGSRLFTDPGFFGTSPFDLGQTTSSSPEDNTGGTDFAFEGDEGFRYDYILHNQPGGDGREFLCMQHLQRRLWTNDDGVGLSDHMPIVADFNKRAPRCSPTLQFSADDNPDGSDVGAPKVTGDVVFKDADTRITWPGNAQWYWVDYDGAMAIGTKGKVAFAVYQAKDLSRPVSSFHKLENEWEVPGPEPPPGTVDPGAAATVYKGPVYVFDDPPYLVKVFATKSIDSASADFGKPDLGAKPTYAISFHEVTCATTKDVCPLKAGDMLPAKWPALPAAPENGEFYPDKMYFHLLAGTASDGSFPEIKVRLRVDAEDVLAPNQPDEIGLKVFRADAYDPTKPDCGPQTPSPCNEALPMLYYGPTTWSPVSGLFETLIDFDESSWALSSPGPPGVPVKYFLRLGRNPDQITSTAMGIRYETTLTLFKPRNLVCHVQESVWWDDYIYARFEVDQAIAGGPNQSCPDDLDNYPGITYLGTFDSDETPLELKGKALQRYYTAKVAPSLCEEDDVDDNDYLSPWNEWSIPIWDPLESKPSGVRKLLFGDSADPEEAAYLYTMSYEVLHEDESE